MKIILVLALAMLLLGSGYIFQLTGKNQLNDQQVSHYQIQVGQLLSEIEANSRSRQQYQRDIDDLQDEASSLSSQLTSVAIQLRQAQQGSADIQALEQELRQQLSLEFQQAGSGSSLDLRTVLVKQLASMETTERAEFLSMQNRYGDFLDMLDVSDERMEVITGAFANMLAVEKQEREEYRQQRRERRRDFTNRSDRWMQIGSQESRLNEMSFVLTEQELTAFSDYQVSERTGADNISYISIGYRFGAGLLGGKSFRLGPISDAFNAGLRETEPDN